MAGELALARGQVRAGRARAPARGARARRRPPALASLTARSSSSRDSWASIASASCPRRSPLRAIRAACWSPSASCSVRSSASSSRSAARSASARSSSSRSSASSASARSSRSACSRRAGRRLGLGLGGVRHRLGRVGDGVRLRGAAAGRAQLGDLGAQLGQLGAEPLVGARGLLARRAGPPLAAAGRRQVHDHAAADLELGRARCRSGRGATRTTPATPRRPCRAAGRPGARSAAGGGRRRRRSARAARAGGPSAPASVPRPRAGPPRPTRSAPARTTAPASRPSALLPTSPRLAVLGQGLGRSGLLLAPLHGGARLRGRRAMVDGGHAVARLATLDREREGHPARGSGPCRPASRAPTRRRSTPRSGRRRRRRSAAGSGSPRSPARSRPARGRASRAGPARAAPRRRSARRRRRSRRAASAPISTSATSKTSHAVSSPYQSRKRLTSSTRPPMATSSGPISNRLIAYR